MKVERTVDEIIIRLPLRTDLSELQDMLDYLKYRELTANSSAKQEDVDKLARKVNSTMWKNIKEQRGLQLMKIVVDSNIVFSAILNTKSHIGQMLTLGSTYFDFYTVQLLKVEIINYKS